MKKLVVLVLALILVISFCSCKPQSNIPVINTSEQGTSSDITQSESTDSKPVNPDPNNTSSTGEEQSSNPSADTNSSLPTTPSDSSGTASENPDKTKPQTDFKICYNQLTDKQKAIYDKVKKCREELATMTEKEMYIDGFRLGACIILDVVCGESKYFTKIC